MERKFLLQKWLSTDHDNDGAGSQQQVNGIAVISGAYTARTVANANAAKAEAQGHNDRAGDIGLEQDRELLMQAGATEWW